MNKCLCAYTVAGSSFPEYLNISVTPDKKNIIITVRGAKKENGDCGETVSIKIGENAFDVILAELVSRYLTRGAL